MHRLCCDVIISWHSFDHPCLRFPQPRTSTATTTPTPALTVDNLLSSPAFSAREPLQRPEPAVPLQIERLRLLLLNYSRTRTQPPVPVPEWMDVREIRNAGKDLTIPTSRGGNQDRTPQRHPLSGITGCNALKTGAKCGRMLQHSTPPRIDTDIVLQTGVVAACERNPIPRLCEMHT